MQGDTAVMLSRWQMSGESIVTDKELSQRKADCKAGRVLSLQQMFWLILASIWLQVIVIVFIIVEIKHRVITPVTDWVNKMILLLGM